MNLWFIPVRRDLNEAKSLDDALNYVRQLCDKEKYNSFMIFESDFCNLINSKQKRFPEKIPFCKYRRKSKYVLEWLCSKINEEDNRCVIHRPAFKFDLPEDCPYLKLNSTYVEFID